MVVIGYSFWQRHFGGDPKIIGKQVTVAGRVYTVTGVMPRGLEVSNPKRKHRLHRAARADLLEPTPNYMIGAGRIFFPSSAV